MFSSVPMTQINVASPVSKLDDVLSVMEKLGCIHIQPYTQFEDGVGIGQARSGEEAQRNSSLLAKARSLSGQLKVSNEGGSMSSSQVEKLLSSGFEDSMDSASSLQGEILTLENDIRIKTEELEVLEILAPLNLPLDLLTGSKSMEVYVAQTNKSSKILDKLSDSKDDIIAQSASNVIAIACSPSVSTDVQVVLAEMGARVIQIPSGEGSPRKISAEFSKQLSQLEADLAAAQEKLEQWASTNGRNLLCAEEYLSRKVEIDLAPTSIAVSKKAFAIDAWTPSSKAGEVKSQLEKVAPYVELSEYVDDHHHDEHHDDEHHHEAATPPTEYDNPGFAKPFELMVDLVGRPAYGKFDPTLLMMFTFPMMFGLILGDFGFGAIIALIALFLKSRAVDPAIKNGMNIMLWMGIWCMIWGFIFAEGFGFVWDNTTDYMTNSPLAFFYDMLPKYDAMPPFITETLAMTHLALPWHRASAGHGLEEYVLISVYLGAIHLMLGFIIGFFSVMKAHGIVAAFFEKGSWILILIGGFMHARGNLRAEWGLFEGTPWAIMLIIGVLCLIVGLAIFEKFGWAGGIIMGPIETFGLLANTLSYLRIMGVGVAGVKIAEVSITMGWVSMTNGFEAGGIGYLTGILSFLLFLGIQAFALALGVLSPSIHAARLHFVEWMGKFYDGSGTAFRPLGGKSLHVEG